MSKLALYREWRPRTFSDVVGQEQAVFPLRQAIIRQEIGHAYLFSGTRGTGKTSLAKIFANAVNCLNPNNGDPCGQCEICQEFAQGSLFDVSEIDAASHNSVDNIRRLTDEIVYLPTKARYKVYIIDEVHMLSSGAFNALLKTLEEPPAHAIFILATTEPQRIPQTILSRCQRFDFRRIPRDKIIERLGQISQAQEIEIDRPALAAIADLAEGALRDAISLLDQAASGLEPPINRDKILDLVGLVADDFMLSFTDSLLKKDLAACLLKLDEFCNSGASLNRFSLDLSHFLRNLLLVKICKNPESLVTGSSAFIADLRQRGQLISSPDLVDLISQLAAINNDLRYSSDQRTSLEIGLITAIKQLPGSLTIEEQVPASAQIEAKVEEKKTEPVTEPKAPASKPENPLVLDFPDQKSPPAQPEPVPPTEQAIVPLETADQVPSGEEIVEEEKPTAQKEPEPEPIEEADPDRLCQMDPQEVWEKVLLELRKRIRIDLQMLLAPAEVHFTKGIWQISYQPEQKAHYQEVSKKANIMLLEDILRQVCDNNYTIEVLLADQTEAKGDNVNPEEADWIKKVRKASEKFGYHVEVE